MYGYMFVYTYIYICIYICIHTYIHMHMHIKLHGASGAAAARSFLIPGTSEVHDKIRIVPTNSGTSKSLEYPEAAATESPGDDKEAEPALEGKEDTGFSMTRENSASSFSVRAAAGLPS